MSMRIVVPQGLPRRADRPSAGLRTAGVFGGSVAISIVLGGVVACGGGNSGDDEPDANVLPADASPSCQEATTYQDFTSIQQNIFVRQCAFMDCHDSVAPESDLDLTGLNARDLLVDVDCSLAVAAGMKRVVAGDPQSSYLMVILGEFPGPIDSNVGTMPLNSPLLCQEKRDAIERWIMAGALDD